MSAFQFDAWPTEYRTINQYFGANPQNYAQFGLPGHEGVDIMAPRGSRIFAVADGQVTRVRREPTGHNYGIHVVIAHRDGYSTTYAHLQEPLVNEGDTVRAGQTLGLANDTGNSFGSHLHLTLKQDGARFGNWPFHIIDPMPYLTPLLGLQAPAGPFIAGWAFTTGIFVVGGLAQVNFGGINLRRQPSVTAERIALVPGGTVLVVDGKRRGQYTPVNVPAAAIGQVAVPAAPTDPPPPPTVATVDGWATTSNLTVAGDRAVVGTFGINLRQGPDRSAPNVGVVRSGATVAVRGDAQNEYLPVRAARADFLGDIVAPQPPPSVTPGQPISPPPGAILGWAATAFLTPLDPTRHTVLCHRFGVNLRGAPAASAPRLGLAKGLATVTICGLARGDYSPVLALAEDVLSVASPLPSVETPEPLPATGAPGPEPAPETPPAPPAPTPPPQSTPGWAATAHLKRDGVQARAGLYGINLRAAPSRDASNVGLVPAGGVMLVTGAAQGEYTPVRVADDVLRPPFDPSAAPPLTDTTRPPDEDDSMDPDPPILGRARLGLHAGADPGDIAESEFAQFAALRPALIKVLSAHSGPSIARLAAEHPEAAFIVRAFLHFGGRNITPVQFVNDTMSDVRRSLDALAGRDVVIELHNEPNLTTEGLGASWSDGAAFGAWFREVLGRYRSALPGRRFLYPGLSPGSAVANLKQDHIQFLEAGRSAVEAADGLGMHIYWSHVYSMEQALTVLDDAIARFRFLPIWVTEASNNKSGTATHVKGRQYLSFWNALQQRPTVQGVTYFVASASDPTFAEESWVRLGLGPLVGRR